MTVDSPSTLRRFRRRWLALACVPPIFAFLFALGSVGLAVLYESSKAQLSVSPADRALVLEVEALRGEFVDRQAAKGTFEKFGYLDGCWELTYSFEDDAVFLTTTVARERSEHEAQVALRAAWLGLHVGAEALNVDSDLVPTPGCRLGDERRLARIEVNGEPIGSVAAVRVGQCVVTVVLQGRWFRNASEAEDALNASVSAVANREALVE